MRKNNLVTSLIVIAVMAMTSGVSSAGFIRFKKSVAKTPAAPADSVPPFIRGTYKFLCIGTGGPDALEPGNEGVVTVSPDGKVFSGTLHYYEDGSTGILSGTINQTQSTGEGSATLRNSRRGWTGYYTFTAKVTSKQYSVLQGEYKEVGSTSKGIFWCIQDAP